MLGKLNRRNITGLIDRNDEYTHTHTAFFLSVSLFSLFHIDTFFMGPQRLPPNHLHYKLCTCKVSGLVGELWWRGEGELKYKEKGAGGRKS